MSRQGKKLSERGALTGWIQQREAFVRTRKGSDRAGVTHSLETTERGTCQDKGRKWLSKEHSQTGDSTVRVFSGHGRETTESEGYSLTRDGRGSLSRQGKKMIEQGALTSYRQRREEPVKT